MSVSRNSSSSTRERVLSSAMTLQADAGSTPSFRAPPAAMDGKAGPGGYRVRYPVLNLVLEKVLASTLLVLSLPVFLILPIIIKLSDGGDVFYRGTRLGKGRKPFNMIKFRTLVQDAESRVGGELLNHRHRLELPCGRFLRDTRLDELPQLFNILAGDMTFLGPRPERPRVYYHQCQDIVGYDKRFRVKPGVFGYSQLFTPHSTPKRMRALIDNQFLGRAQSMRADLVLILTVMWRLGLRAGRRIVREAYRRVVLIGSRGSALDQRTLARIQPEGLTLQVRTERHAVVDDQPLIIDINEEHILICTGRELPDTQFVLEMTSNVHASGRWRHRKIMCFANVVIRRSNGPVGYENAYVIHYTAQSPLNAYMIDKYVLRKSIF